MSKVSIIIPAYQQASYLGQTIESALGQTHPDLEVVVIDDGSPDATPAVAARYRDRPNFKYVRQDNTGLAGARNRGIVESTGDYLCFLDADDLYLPAKVAQQAAMLDRNPDAGFTYCDITTIDEHDKPVADQFFVANAKRDLSGDIFPSLMLSGYFPPHTVMIRRAVLDQVGPFDFALGGYADYELWLRVAGAGFKAIFIAERLALYRRHSTNMSKDGQHMGETRLATLQKIARLYPEKTGRSLAHLQQMNADLGLANGWLQRKAEQSPLFQSPLGGGGAANPRDLQVVAAWQAKLEAANTLVAMNQPAAAARLMLEGIKVVENNTNLHVTLEAIVEIGENLAPLDAGRARYLLDLALKLAGNLQDYTTGQRARRILAQLGQATPADQVPAHVGINVQWRAKLETAVALSDLKQGKAAVELMMQSLKVAETSKQPEIILAALLEVSPHLAKHDTGRTRVLLETTQTLARRMNRPEAVEFAAQQLVRLKGGPARKATMAV